MAEAVARNCVGFQPMELKLDCTWKEGERPSSSTLLTNPTDRRVGFAVEVTDPDKYEVKPSRGSVPPSGTCRINGSGHGQVLDLWTLITTLLCLVVVPRGSPLDEQREGKFSVLVFHVDDDLVFPEKDHHQAISCHSISHNLIRVRWVNPETEIPVLMNKAVEEVYEQNLWLAGETLRQAIELRRGSHALSCRALVHQMLGEKEEATKDLQEAELAEGKREPSASSGAHRIISDIAKVPTYTTEKLCAKQIIVNWNVAVTQNQRLEVEVHLTPSIMLRPDGPYVEVILVVDLVRFEVVRVLSERAVCYPNHFLQSLKIVLRPTGKWCKSFPEHGCGLTKYTPGSEHNSETMQQGRSSGYTGALNVGSSPSAVVQWTQSRTSGTTFLPHGFHKSERDGHAYVCVYKLRTFEDGSCAQNLDGKRFLKVPDIPEAARGQINYNLTNYAGTWLVPSRTATELWNEIGFTISFEAKVPALQRSSVTNPMHWVKPPKPVLVKREQKTFRTCAFALARLKRFIEEST